MPTRCEQNVRVESGVQTVTPAVVQKTEDECISRETILMEQQFLAISRDHKQMSMLKTNATKRANT